MKYRVGDFVSYGGGLLKGIVVKVDGSLSMAIYWLVEGNTKKPQWYYQQDEYVKKLGG